MKDFRLGKQYINHSVSIATLRTGDLIEASESLLRVYGLVPENRPAACEKIDTSHFHHDGLADDITEEERDDLLMYLDDLFDLLDSIAPEGCYFGAHPGDGAEIGFWQFEEEGE